MKILFISDEESKYYWDYYSPDKLEDIDLIISCGDLAPQYLSFLVHYLTFQFFTYMVIMTNVIFQRLQRDACVLMTI